MRYISTRGQVTPVTFSQAVMMGLATDGGLLLPEHIPVVDSGTLERWTHLPFVTLAYELISLFVSAQDIPKIALKEMVDRSFGKFTHPEITPVVNVGKHYVLELFHGPSLAFKDVALQFLGNLFEYLLVRQGGVLNILGATSGDTGSAAIHGVRGRAGIRIFILHPHGRVSPIQERQMTTVLDDNVTNIAIEGTFDDGQRIVKNLFNDLEFKKKYHLGAVNSINWARIVAQIVYYFYAWGRVAPNLSEKQVIFSVPTGNFGDIFAGYMALRMGLPVERLILATNRNDILTRFFHSGTYQVGEVSPTISPSMDIQISSNFERFLYYLLDENPSEINQLMMALEQKGGFSVPQSVLAKAQKIFIAQAVNDAETLATIRNTYQSEGYLLDPHTAVGVKAAEPFPGAICLATAHPAKFGDAVARAIGEAPPLPQILADLAEKPTRCHVLPANTESVRDFIVGVMK